MSRPVPWPRELADLPYAAALTAHDGGLRPGAEYDTILFDRAGFEGAEASGARFVECAFTAASLHDSRLRRARFTASWLKEVRVARPRARHRGRRRLAPRIAVKVPRGAGPDHSARVVVLP